MIQLNDTLILSDPVVEPDQHKLFFLVTYQHAGYLEEKSGQSDSIM